MDLKGWSQMRAGSAWSRFSCLQSCCRQLGRDARDCKLGPDALRWSLLAPKNLPLAHRANASLLWGFGQGEVQAGEVQAGQGVGAWVSQARNIDGSPGERAEGMELWGGDTPQTGITKAGQVTVQPWSIFCSPWRSLMAAPNFGGAGWEEVAGVRWGHPKATTLQARRGDCPTGWGGGQWRAPTGFFSGDVWRASGDDG